MARTLLRQHLIPAAAQVRQIGVAVWRLRRGLGVGRRVAGQQRPPTLFGCRHTATPGTARARAVAVGAGRGTDHSAQLSQCRSARQRAETAFCLLEQILIGFCNNLRSLALVARHSNDDSEHCADQRVDHGMTGLAATEAANPARSSRCWRWLQVVRPGYGIARRWAGTAGRMGHRARLLRFYGCYGWVLGFWLYQTGPGISGVMRLP